jgi:uncharacterized Zn-finger protein
VYVRMLAVDTEVDECPYCSAVQWLYAKTLAKCWCF